MRLPLCEKWEKNPAQGVLHARREEPEGFKRPLESAGMLDCTGAGGGAGAGDVDYSASAASFCWSVPAPLSPRWRPSSRRPQLRCLPPRCRTMMLLQRLLRWRLFPAENLESVEPAAQRPQHYLSSQPGRWTAPAQAMLTTLRPPPPSAGQCRRHCPSGGAQAATLSSRMSWARGVDTVILRGIEVIIRRSQLRSKHLSTQLWRWWSSS